MTKLRPFFRTLIFLGALAFAAPPLLGQEPTPAPAPTPTPNPAPGEAGGETPAKPAEGNKPGPEEPATTFGEVPGEEAAGITGKERVRLYAGRFEENRLRVSFGFGRGKVTPGAIAGVSQAWLINSVAQAGQNSLYQPAFPLGQGGAASYFSFHTGLQWAYKDRLFVSAEYYHINEELGSDNATTQSFFHPQDNRFRWSFFEGMRLVNYIEDRRNIEVKYLHPLFLRGLKLGLHISREWVDEQNDISYGSYQATAVNGDFRPNTVAYSLAGVVPGNYQLKGWLFGPALRYQLFNWFSLHYRMGIMDRKGSYDQSGFQVLTINDELNGVQGGALLLPFATGEVIDSGTRHILEAVFHIYCRYTITVGYLREDFSRSYSSYWGATPGTVPNLYSTRTPGGLGIGEISSSGDFGKNEFYVKFGTDFFF